MQCVHCGFKQFNTPSQFKGSENYNIVKTQFPYNLTKKTARHITWCLKCAQAASKKWPRNQNWENGCHTAKRQRHRSRPREKCKQARPAAWAEACSTTQAPTQPHAEKRMEWSSASFPTAGLAGRAVTQLPVHTCLRVTCGIICYGAVLNAYY